MALRPSFLPPAQPTSRRSAAEGKPPLSFKERVGALRYLPPLFRLLWAISPPMVVANGLLRLVRAAVPLLTLLLGKWILNEVVRLTGLPAAARDLTHLWTLVGGEIGLVLLSDGLTRAVALLDSLLGDRFSIQTSVQLMEHAAKLDLEQFEDATFYDKLDRARRNTTGRTALMSQVLGQIQDLVTVGFLAVGLIAFSPWLILLLVVALVPAFLGEAHFNGLSYSLTFGWTPERRELDYLRLAGASDETAKEVKIFGLDGFLIERFRTLSERFYRANRSLALRRASWGAGLAAVGSAGYYAAYAFILIRTVSGQLTLGDLVFLSGSFSRLRGLMQGILQSFSSVAEGALYLKDLFDFFEIRPRVASPVAPIPVPNPIREGFRFEGVGFRYPNAERWVLRDLSFTLQAGEKLALVGENGAGKTTLVKLLARLYDPTEGRITLDGRDLRDYDLVALRREIGVIFQDFVKFQLSAGENIAVGRIEARTDQPRIEDAADRSLADTVVAKLPEGYAQVIGRRFAGGVDLSGGEWQKIALARAYMRDAQLLILDEPTAALDARAEHEVFERFSELTRGKMAVLISHRFSTVRMADRILVLDGGRQLEIGTHADLLAANGRYAELFSLQAEGYR